MNQNIRPNIIPFAGSCTSIITQWSNPHILTDKNLLLAPSLPQFKLTTP